MAEIGYRMAQKHTRQGHATRAVGLLLKDVFGKYGLHRVEAATSPHNIASQIVLLKNKFQFWGRARSSFFVNGVWHDSVLFERFDEV